MKITIFDRKKYEESLRLLNKRSAPNYVIEAYKDGYASVVNNYYAIKLERKIKKLPRKISKTIFEQALRTDKNFVKEALSKRDEDFLKAFFKMTNLNIMTGDKLPPNAGKLLKRAKVKDLGLKDLFKKLR